MKVEIRPIDKPKWHGLKDDKVFTRPKSFQAFVENGMYKVIFASDEEREYLEKTTGYDLSLGFNSDRPHPTWPSKPFWVKLEPNTMFIDTTKPMDAIHLAEMRGSPLVANSMSEYEAGLWPDATHVISSEEEDYEVKAKKIDIQNMAARLSMDMTEERRIQIIQIIDRESFRGKKKSFIDVKIKELVDNNPKEFIRWANEDAEELAVRSLVLEAVWRGALKKDGPSFLYGDDRIGIDLDDAVKFLKNPENQRYRVRIMELLEK